MSDSLDEYPIGKKLTIKCDTGYYQNGLQGKKTIKATCSCNGNWEYDPEVPNCKRKILIFVLRKVELFSSCHMRRAASGTAAERRKKHHRRCALGR